MTLNGFPPFCVLSAFSLRELATPLPRKPSQQKQEEAGGRYSLEAWFPWWGDVPCLVLVTPPAGARPDQPSPLPAASLTPLVSGGSGIFLYLCERRLHAAPPHRPLALRDPPLSLALCAAVTRCRFPEGSAGSRLSEQHVQVATQKSGRLRVYYVCPPSRGVELPENKN